VAIPVVTIKNKLRHIVVFKKRVKTIIFHKIYVMKKIILSAAILLTAYFTSTGKPVVAQGQTNTLLGDYKITMLDDHLVINGKELTKYLVSYDRPDMKAIVAVDQKKGCKKYYVLSGELAVQYECNGTSFGITRLDKEFNDKGFITSMDKLNKLEFYHQRVLTSEPVNTIDHLNMIASYYPGLLNEKVL
jgi:hypothetical protein